MRAQPPLQASLIQTKWRQRRHPSDVGGERVTPQDIPHVTDAACRTVHQPQSASREVEVVDLLVRVIVVGHGDFVWGGCKHQERVDGVGDGVDHLHHLLLWLNVIERSIFVDDVTA